MLSAAHAYVPAKLWRSMVLTRVASHFRQQHRLIEPAIHHENLFLDEHLQSYYPARLLEFMPRLPPWLFRQAKKRSPELATLLPACRDLGSATNELRWIKEHALKSYRHDVNRRISNLCAARGRGVPLQYILGTQPFGDEGCGDTRLL